MTRKTNLKMKEVKLTQQNYRKLKIRQERIVDHSSLVTAEKIVT